MSDIVSSITRVLCAGRDARCSLGTFRLYEYAAYEGRNPYTGEAVPVPAKRTVVFIPSPALVEASFGGDRVPVPATRYETEPSAADPRHVGTSVEDVVAGDAIVREIGDKLRQGKRPGISGLGKFITRRLPRRPMNDDDGQAFEADLAGKWVISLHVSAVLKDALRHR